MLQVNYLNSFAVVYVDGKKAGTLRYPAGKVEVTAACRPARKHTLSLLVLAMPLNTPLLTRFSSPVVANRAEQRWLEGFYLDVPEEWDDPYRFLRW
jgi:hypothetical protein